MKILITGGSGGLGRELTPRLLANGHEVRILSRSPRKANAHPDMDWAQASLETGEGLEKAVVGMDAVIHAASDLTKAQKVDVDGTYKLLAASERAKIKHLLYVSIVGVDQHPFFYYQKKYAAEKLVESGNVPWSILRATQFHSLLDWFFLPTFFKIPGTFLPTDFQFQLVDTGEVAEQIAAAIGDPPGGRLPDVAGPEILTMGELAEMWMQAKGIQRKVRHWNMPGNAAAAFRAGVNTAPDRAVGKITFADWLKKQYGVSVQDKLVSAPKQA